MIYQGRLWRTSGVLALANDLCVEIATTSQPALIGLPSTSSAPYLAPVLQSLKQCHSTATDRPRPAASSDDDIQRRVLTLALTFVPALGWSRAAVEAAADELSLSRAVVGSFRRGAEAHLVERFNQDCNRQLQATLANAMQEHGNVSGRDRLVLGLRKRLEMLLPVIDTWPDALAIQARPGEVPRALGSYSDIADVVWKAAGDRSADFSWYTRRGLLSGAYIASELYMIQDCSPNFENTWQALGRRVDDAMALGMKPAQEEAGEACKGS
jgi:ubiquinone biosynthesis protein COQ9